MAERKEDFSRLEISLPGCLENYRYFRSKIEPSTRLLVLVKANAYGHGAVEFASLMEEAGADYLAVAYPVEGMELRQAGIKSPIMVLTAGTDFFNESNSFLLSFYTSAISYKTAFALYHFGFALVLYCFIVFHVTFPPQYIL